MGAAVMTVTCLLSLARPRYRSRTDGGFVRISCTASSRRRRRLRRRPDTTAYASRLIAIVLAVPCANRLNGASVCGGGATVAFDALNDFMPFSDDSIEMSIPSTALGNVDVNPDDSVGSLARNTNIT